MGRDESGVVDAGGAGARVGNGRVSALTTYPAPPGADWGWRIELVAEAADEFTIRMVNIPPGEDELLAVEAQYGRVHAA